MVGAALLNTHPGVDWLAWPLEEAALRGWIQFAIPDYTPLPRVSQTVSKSATQVTSPEYTEYSSIKTFSIDAH